MLAVTSGRSFSFTLPRLALEACPSSWISWVCYWSAAAAALTPRDANEVLGGGVAAAVLAGGLAAFFLAVVAIQRHMRLELSATSYGTPRNLVTTGVFRYSRNPIYVAFLLPLASLAYFSIAAATVGILTYVLIMTSVVIRSEERVLVQRFGEEYLAYTRSVRRWIGWSHRPT